MKCRIQCHKPRLKPQHCSKTFQGLVLMVYIDMCPSLPLICGLNQTFGTSMSIQVELFVVPNMNYTLYN